MGGAQSHHEIRGKYNWPKEGGAERASRKRSIASSPKQQQQPQGATTSDGSARSTASTTTSTWIHPNIDVENVYDLNEVIAYGHLGPIQICSRKRVQHSNHTGEFIMVDNVITRSERTSNSSESSSSPTRGTYHRLFACKTISTSRLSNESEAVPELLHQMTQLRELPHFEHVLSPLQVYVTKRHLYLITELCTGGDITSRVDWNTELDVTNVLQQIASALSFLHSHDIVHGNLKLENVLYEHAGSNAGIKLADFGVSKTFAKCSECCRTACGAEYAAAPYSQQQGYAAAKDVWSMGAIAFYLLSGGVYPFGTDMVVDEPRLETAALEFGDEWQQRGISDMAKSFCRCCFTCNPQEQWSATDALQYIQEWKTSLETSPLQKQSPEDARIAPAPALDVSLRGVQDFGLYGQGRKRLLYCLANLFDRDQLQQLQDYFVEMMDSTSNANGTLTLNQVKKAVKLYRKQEESSHLTKADVKEMFKGYHQDGSETIEYESFLQAVLQMQGMLAHERLGEALDRADPEDKGLLEMEEMKRILGTYCDLDALEPIMEKCRQDNSMVEYNAVLQRFFQDPAKTMNHVRRIPDSL